MKNPKKFNLVKNYTVDNTYFLHLKLSGQMQVMMKCITRGSAIIFNKSIELQKNCFDEGFTAPLTALEIRPMLDKWRVQPGMGFIRNVPPRLLYNAIEDACLKSMEAFRDNKRFKFPSNITDGYKHLEFKKNVTWNNELCRIKFQGFEADFKYVKLDSEQVVKGPIVGRLSNAWIAWQENEWLALVWTKTKGVAGFRAAPSLVKEGKRRVSNLLPYTYDKTHWIVAAHERREAMPLLLEQEPEKKD